MKNEWSMAGALNAVGTSAGWMGNAGSGTKLLTIITL